MHTTDSSFKTRFKVGIFTLVGLFSVGALTVYVNDRPYWYRSCQLVHINVEDATGLKTKSAVRSLGLEIGYLKNVELTETHVRLGICITAPVEVLTTTRAYIRGEGFLGDKFVELKPVKYLGNLPESETQDAEPSSKASSGLKKVKELWIPEAAAAEPVAQAQPEPQPVPSPTPSPRLRTRRGGREIPVGTGAGDMQAVVGRVDQLVGEMTNLTANLKQAIRPEELRDTMKQLNRALENASKTIAPEGSLNQTAQRSLAKLEDAIEQLRLIMTRINKGEGSVGKLLNDPVYADEIHEAIKNVNRLLGKVSDLRLTVDVGGQIIRNYEGARAWFRLAIWPKKDRYYLLGISVDPRGRRTKLRTTTVAGSSTTSIETTQLEETGLLLTVMLGKIYWDVLDLSIGAFNGDGAVSVGLNLGPSANRDVFQIKHDIYARSGENSADGRLTFTIRPWLGTYVSAGLESYNRIDGRLPYFYGAGVSFDDEDIKLLFALR